MSKWIAILVGTGLLVGSGQIASAAGGTVTGKVVLKGSAPAAQKLTIDKDPSICGTEQQSEEVVVGPGQGIRYAVVRLIGAAGAPDAAKPGCLKKVSQKSPEAEVVKLTCDVHTWMSGWLVVAGEAFVAVKEGADARFSFDLAGS